jgi:succinate-semialdehyde dehydrogenase/glutarate-semialdehyde dehydrogenase
MSASPSYSDTQLFIDNTWRATSRALPVINPATEIEIGRVSMADTTDLDEATAASLRGFKTWRKVPAFERSALMRRAAQLMRERAEDIAVTDDGTGQAACGVAR